MVSQASDGHPDWFMLQVPPSSVVQLSAHTHVGRPVQRVGTAVGAKVSPAEVGAWLFGALVGPTVACRSQVAQKSSSSVLSSSHMESSSVHSARQW